MAREIEKTNILLFFGHALSHLSWWGSTIYTVYVLKFWEDCVIEEITGHYTKNFAYGLIIRRGERFDLSVGTRIL
jgi:hypothetical protein